MFRRYSTVRQNDKTDCGAAALATVALHFRIPLAFEEVRQLAGTDRVGTNLWGLAQAAENLGFAAKAVRGSSDALREIPLPAIAHVTNEDGQGHFVVLYSVRRRCVVIADPAHGLRKLAHDAFTACWTGYLLLLVPEPMGSTKDARHRPKTPCHRLARLLLSQKPVLFEAFSCAVLMTLLGISTSYFVQHLVDSVLRRGETRLLNALAVGMLLMVAFRSMFAVLRRYLLAHVGRHIDLTLISSCARHLVRLPLRFFEMRQVGEILSRINDTGKVREAISGAMLTMLVDGVLVSLSLAALWIQDAPLALVATLFGPLLMGSVVAHHPLVRMRSRGSMESAAALSAHLVEDMSGVETIKAFGVERDRAEAGESRLVRFVQDVFSLQLLGISMYGAGTLVTGSAGIVILWFGGYRVIDGALTIGQLMFFYTLLGYMLGPLERLASVNLQLQDAMVAVDRLFQIMDVDMESGNQTRYARFEGVRNAIEFQDVCFRYGCREHVLDHVSLRIPAGKTVAVVGASGSGKSTLLKLLLRFYDPVGGRILVDGIDSLDIELGSLRERIGFVAQDAFIFNATVRENVALGRPGATMQEVVQAARLAGLDSFVSRLPERYDTIIGERGTNLSGGQRQRLAIARALLRKPDILIFDEATSHLDTATERHIQKSLTAALVGKTVVLVAHRLSTIRHADIIYVMEEGRIIESGDHDQLIEKDGRYAGLWRAQTGVEASAAETPSVCLDRPANGRTYLGVLDR